MIPYIGDIVSGTTLYHLWNSNTSLGASVTRATNGTVYIYKDLTTSSETTLGVTDSEDFDSVTGVHAVTVNTTAAFYATGSEYHAILKSATIDGATVSAGLFAFSIENRSTHPKSHYPSNFSKTVIDTSGIVDADVRQWLGTAAATPTTAGVPEVDVTHWLGTAAATPTVGGVPEVDVTHWLGTAAATPTTAGVPEVDVTHWRGTAAPAEHTSGYPIVTIKDGTGTGEIDTASGRVAITEAQIDQIVDEVLDEDMTGHQTQGTLGQAIGDPAADTNTIFKAVVTDATGATVGVDVVAIKAETVEILADTAEIGAAGAGLTNINLPNQTMDIVGNITGNLSGSVGSVTGAVSSVTGAVGSVTGNVGGNVTGSVGSVLGGLNTTAGVITTLDGLDTAQDSQHSTTQTAIDALPTNAELATALGTADDAVLAQIALVKAKTDSLTFTVAGEVDANVQSINDTGVAGTGDSADKWRAV